VDQIDHLVVEHDVEATVRAAFEAKSITVYVADQGTKGADPGQ
jgi:hypothetical protein